MQAYLLSLWQIMPVKLLLRLANYKIRLKASESNRKKHGSKLSNLSIRSLMARKKGAKRQRNYKMGLQALESNHKKRAKKRRLLLIRLLMGQKKAARQQKVPGII